MKDGFYNIKFHAPQGHGGAVGFLQGGKIYGGDSITYFSGTFTEQGGEISAEVTTGVHTREPGVGTLFGRDKVTISLRGKPNGTGAQLSGTVNEIPGLRLEAHITPLPV